MPIASITSLSKEDVYIPVKARVDPTAFPVEVALTATDAEPVAGNWGVAAWDGPARLLAPGRYEGRARLLTGPLPDGRRAVWVRVTATPEVPVMKAGLLDVT